MLFFAWLSLLTPAFLCFSKSTWRPLEEWFGCTERLMPKLWGGGWYCYHQFHFLRTTSHPISLNLYFSFGGQNHTCPLPPWLKVSIFFRYLHSCRQKNQINLVIGQIAMYVSALWNSAPRWRYVIIHLVCTSTCGSCVLISHISTLHL